MTYQCQPLKIKVYRKNHCKTIKCIVTEAKIVFLLLLVRANATVTVHFLDLEKCPLFFVFFLQMKDLNRSSVCKCWGVSFQPQQLLDSTKYSLRAVQLENGSITLTSPLIYPKCLPFHSYK